MSSLCNKPAGVGQVEGVDVNSTVHRCREVWAPLAGALVHGCHDNAVNAALRVQVLSVLPLAAVHTLGNLITNVSLGQVAVSFTHTIKASFGPQCMHKSSDMYFLLLLFAQLSIHFLARVPFCLAGNAFSCRP